MLVKRDLLAAMAAPPPPLPIPCLVDDNSVNPGAQRRPTPEGANPTEDSKKHFLGKIEGPVVVAHQGERQLVHYALVSVHELDVGLALTGRATLDERGFAAAKFRPTDHLSWLDRHL